MAYRLQAALLLRGSWPEEAGRQLARREADRGLHIPVATSDTSSFFNFFLGRVPIPSKSKNQRNIRCRSGRSSFPLKPAKPKPKTPRPSVFSPPWKSIHSEFYGPKKSTLSSMVRPGQTRQVSSWRLKSLGFCRSKCL